MKLLKIKLPKMDKDCAKKAITSILKKYPDADVDSIYATMLNAGFIPKFGTITGYRSQFVREQRIRKEMGIK